LPFLLLAILALLTALCRADATGWQLPAFLSLALRAWSFNDPDFGTLITPERAVAMNKSGCIFPFLAGIGWLVTVLIQTLPLGPFLLTLASLGGVAILIEMARREFALHTVTMLLGMLAWFVGNLLWLFGWQIFQVVFFWQAFLVLTIAGERLELSRVLRPSRIQQNLFGAIIAIFLVAIIVSIFNPQIGHA
jgi:hypothetical protein